MAGKESTPPSQLQGNLHRCIGSRLGGGSPRGAAGQTKHNFRSFSGGPSETYKYKGVYGSRTSNFDPKYSKCEPTCSHRLQNPNVVTSPLGGQKQKNESNHQKIVGIVPNKAYKYNTTLYPKCGKPCRPTQQVPPLSRPRVQSAPPGDARNFAMGRGPGNLPQVGLDGNKMEQSVPKFHFPRGKFFPTNFGGQVPRVVEPPSPPNPSHPAAYGDSATSSNHNFGDPIQTPLLMVGDANENSSQDSKSSDTSSPKFVFASQRLARGGSPRVPVDQHRKRCRSLSVSRTTKSRKTAKALTLQNFILQEYKDKGLNPDELSWIAQQYSAKTLARYESAFALFIKQLVQTGSIEPDLHKILKELRTTPHCRVSAWLARMGALYSPSQVRNAYSGLILLPCCQQLRFESTMRSIRCQWSPNNPKYEIVSSVPELLIQLRNASRPATEIELRDRAINLLGFYACFEALIWLGHTGR